MLLATHSHRWETADTVTCYNIRAQVLKAKIISDLLGGRVQNHLPTYLPTAASVQPPMVDGALRVHISEA